MSGKDKGFYFLEMNTRLQVEHPVTEMITGVDLVEQMLRVAAGEPLAIKQDDLKISGWAIESRVYAEDPYRNFLPSIGRLRRFRPPSEGKLGEGTVRMDSGVREGDEISMYYDPMIAKLVTHGPTRDAALDTQAAALDRFHIEGIQDNIPFVAAVMDEKRFRSGDITTGYIKEEFPEGFSGTEPTSEQAKFLVAAASYAHVLDARRAMWVSGQMQAPAEIATVWTVLLNGKPYEVDIELGDGDATIKRKGKKTHVLKTDWTPGTNLFEGTLDGEAFAVSFGRNKAGRTIRHRGASRHVITCEPRLAALYAKLPEKEAPDTSKLVLSPMPGMVVSVSVEVGQDVKAGEGVCIVEAMKMQNIIRAEADGTVKAVNVEAGGAVAADEIMVEFA
ncbi:MAG: biotin/lipoyl-containing protein [Pseudomonadota bacterium]